jgi:Ser/Thr protein kinase RdoA (MazF antagonist)
LLAVAVELIGTRLKAYGRAPERYGLIHADVRSDNLLSVGDEIRIIDFDDCGDSWYLYDLACATTIFEGRPDLAELSRAWIEGYRTVRPLSADDIAIVPTLVMVRRIVVCGWIATRQGTYLDGNFLADLR